MSIEIKITVDDAVARERLESLQASVEDRTQFNAALAQRGLHELEEHFLRRPHNKRGWTPQNFWAQIRSATSVREVTADHATLVVADPRMAQKVYGGTIRPVRGKFLALPAIAEAYGKLPRSLDNLHIIFRRGGEPVGLAENLATNIRLGSARKDGSRKVTAESSRRGAVWFWLVKSVTQRPDPEALPADANFAAALREEAIEYLNRLAS